MEYQHPPPDTKTFNMIKTYLGRKINKELDCKSFRLENLEDPFVFAVMRKVIRQEVKDLEDIVSWFRDEYKRYLIPDQEIFFHKQWIWNNKKISENLARKRNSKLFQYAC